ncbi:MAG: prolipoprotein diacylglyceryl transferase [Blautia sp.]|nr:prolipoprotein diacylglyceryl transferase [Blautia sp.]
MKSELWHIGPLTIYGYGFMIGLGILSAWVLTSLRARKRQLDPDRVFSMVAWAAIGGLGGAKLLFLVLEFRELLTDPVYFIHSLGDGFVVYGGIIGGILAIWLYCRKKRESFLYWFDFLIPQVALGQAFGRLGCLLSGCCYGRVTSHFPYLVFSESVYAPNHVMLIPTQVYSSILNFANCLFLLALSRHTKKDGQVGAAYLICYSGGRFILEFFRGDTERGYIGLLSTSQFIAVFTFLAGILLLVWTCAFVTVRSHSR